MTNLKVYLLTHERELERKTSTSHVVNKVLGEYCETIVWKRKEPDTRFLDALSPSNSVLLYKGEEENAVGDTADIENFILLEGTWQEARKIYNRSPYLKRYKLLTIKPSSLSEYKLRRNQVESGLSTAEAVIEVLRLKGESKRADLLYKDFIIFQSS